MNRTLNRRRPLLLLSACILAAVLFCVQLAFAATGHYQVSTQKGWEFENFDSAITVNKDGSLTVREREVADFRGSFTFLNRDLYTGPARFSSGTTSGPVDYKNIKVFDLNGAPYPTWSLEKSAEGTRVHITFSAANEQKGWIIEYTMTGAIIYAKDYDRLYFNAVSVERDVPIKASNVTITLPQGTDMSKVKSTSYTSDVSPPASVTPSIAGNTLMWETIGIAPQTTLTVDVAFPKGVVKGQSSSTTWIYVLIGFLALLLVAGVGVWIWSRSG